MQFAFRVIEFLKSELCGSRLQTQIGVRHVPAKDAQDVLGQTLTKGRCLIVAWGPTVDLHDSRNKIAEAVMGLNRRAVDRMKGNRRKLILGAERGRMHNARIGPQYLGKSRVENDPTEPSDVAKPLGH